MHTWYSVISHEYKYYNSIFVVMEDVIMFLSVLNTNTKVNQYKTLYSKAILCLEYLSNEDIVCSRQ